MDAREVFPLATGEVVSPRGEFGLSSSGFSFSRGDLLVSGLEKDFLSLEMDSRRVGKDFLSLGKDRRRVGKSFRSLGIDYRRAGKSFLTQGNRLKPRDGFDRTPEGRTPVEKQ